MNNLRKQAVVSSHPSYSFIPLTRGFVAVVDAADFDWLSKWNWHVYKHATGTFYAVRRVNHGDGAYTLIFMHRVILKTRKGYVGDHWNGDTLDNRRCNLRNVKRRKNNQNRKVYKCNSSGYPGIRPMKGCNRLMVRIGDEYLGLFETWEEAIRVRQAAERRVFREMSRLKSPPVIARP